MKRAISLCLWGILVAMPGRALSAEPSDTVVKISVEGEPSDWILDEKSGRVFVALADKACIVEFDPSTGKEVRRFEIRGPTRDMTIKGNRLVVAVAEAVSLCVINLDDNEVEGRAFLQGSGPAALFCTKAANPYVYAVSSGIEKVDVHQRAVLGRAHLQAQVSTVSQIIPSADGQHLLVSDDRGGGELIEFDEGAFTFRRVAGLSDVRGQATAGPANRYWMVGKQLLPINLLTSPGIRVSGGTVSKRRGLREYAGSPALIHPTLDLVVSVEDYYSTLRFQRFSNPGDLTSVTLMEREDASLPASTRYGSLRHTPVLQFDVARNRVFFAVSRNATPLRGSVGSNLGYIVDMSRLDLPENPLVLLTMPSTVDARIGEELRVPLTLTDDKLTPRATFSLEDAPEGMRIEDGHLVWHPKEKDIGRYGIKVSVQLGDVKDTASINVSASRPSLRLAMSPMIMSVDPAGKHILLLGVPHESLEYTGTARTSSKELRLVDLESMSVVAKRTFEERVSDVLLTESGAYALLSGSGLWKLSMKDLSNVSTTTERVTGPSLAAAFRGHLAVYYANALRLLDEGTLKEVTICGEEVMNGDAFLGRDRITGSELLTPLEEACVVGPFVVDQDSGTPQLLLPPSAIPGWSKRTETTRLSRWGRYLKGRAVLTNAGEPFLGDTQSARILARDLPAVIDVVASQPTDISSGETVSRLAIEVRDLVEGKIVHRIPLEDVPLRETGASQAFYRTNSMLPVETAGNRVICACSSSLYVVELSKEVIDKLSEPLRFLPKTSDLQMKVGETPVVKVAVRGGKGKRTFSLVYPLDGVRVDEANGDLDIDTTVVWASYVEYLKRSPATSPTRPNPTWRVESAQHAYEQLTRHTTEAFPIVFAFTLKVTDEQGASDMLNPKFLLLGPTAEVIDAMTSASSSETPATTPRDAGRVSPSEARRAATPAPVPDNPSPREPSAAPDQASLDLAGEIGTLAASVEALRGDVRALQEQTAPLATLEEAVDLGTQEDEKSASRLASLVERHETLEGDLAEVQGRDASQNHYLLVGLVVLCAQFVAWLALFFLMRSR